MLLSRVDSEGMVHAPMSRVLTVSILLSASSFYFWAPQSLFAAAPKAIPDAAAFRDARWGDSLSRIKKLFPGGTTPKRLFSKHYEVDQPFGLQLQFQAVLDFEFKFDRLVAYTARLLSDLDAEHTSQQQFRDQLSELTSLYGPALRDDSAARPTDLQTEATAVSEQISTLSTDYSQNATAIQKLRAKLADIEILDSAQELVHRLRAPTPKAIWRSRHLEVVLSAGFMDTYVIDREDGKHCYVTVSFTRRDQDDIVNMGNTTPSGEASEANVQRR